MQHKKNRQNKQRDDKKKLKILVYIVVHEFSAFISSAISSEDEE